MKTTPELSAIVLVNPDVMSRRRTLRTLRAQTVASRIQIVLVRSSTGRPTDEAPPWDTGNGESWRDVFHDVVEVSPDPDATFGERNAAGVLHATAPLIAFTEDHCFCTDEKWAQQIIDRHREDRYAVVAPRITNANPATLASWAQFLIEYGVFSNQKELEIRREVPGHNAVYRADAFDPYRDNLGWWLEVETLLQWDMADQGEKHCVDPTIRLNHYNVSRVWPIFTFGFTFSRVFAGYRRETLSKPAVWKYRFLWPLIPLLRFKRVIPEACQCLGVGAMLKTLPLLMFSLAASGIGEGLGYWFGPSKLHVCHDLELQRGRFMRPSEKIECWLGHAPEGSNRFGSSD